ncbi:MAG: hypothetical protein HPY85_10675 [Anaerolineae bacterium]|nr:hypothetical protein [Anaerolineae bacterium]
MIDTVRLRPVMQIARRLDVYNNPGSQACYIPGQSGFQIAATPDDHPAGWDRVKITAPTTGQCRPYTLVAVVEFEMRDDEITHLLLTTAAEALRELDQRYLIQRDAGAYVNRPADLLWARQKVTWLFHVAGVPMPAIKIK